MNRKRKPPVFVPLLLLSMALSLLAGAQSASKTNPAPEAFNLLCHKWNLADKNGMLQTGCFPAGFSNIDFCSNGHIVFTGSYPVEGVYRYDSQTRNLLIHINNRLWNYKILSLSEKVLVLENTRGKTRAYLWSAYL